MTKLIGMILLLMFVTVSLGYVVRSVSGVEIHRNMGIAFAIEVPVVVVWVIGLVFPTALIWRQRNKLERRVLRWGLGLFCAGAYSNLLDRAMHGGAVLDYIDLGFFPVFNLADVFITIGVILLILEAFVDDKRRRQI